MDLCHGKVIEGDALNILEGFDKNKFHAIVTDPPYAISFMDEEWDQFRRKRNENDSGRSDVGGRLSSKAPASGAEGDNYEYQQWCMLWGQAAKRVLKPGGHVIAFSGNRTHHRLMTALEDVGYEIRDTITWHYGEGMPKGARLSTWLDGDEAEEWGDWRGTLKPATEFAILARAPFTGSATQNQVTHGVGNLNVEQCRIATSDDTTRPYGNQTTTRTHGEFSGDAVGGSDDGRYPANVVLDPVMAAVMDLLEDDISGGDDRGECTGERESGFYDIGSDSGDGVPNSQVYADTGGASRFFYCSKASKSERTHNGDVENDHPTVKPRDLMEWLIKMVTAEEQWVLDPFVGSGTTILAGEECNRNIVGIEQDETYAELARERYQQFATTA